MIVQTLTVSEAIGWAAVADLARLATVGMFALNMYFLRDVYREFKELRTTSEKHGERIARLEGAQEN